MVVHLAMQRFSAFVESLHATDFDEVRSRATVAVENPEAFEEMRRFLIERYAGMEAVHSFMEPGGEVVDCIPAEQQPSLRKTGGALLPPPEPPLEPEGYQDAPGFASPQPHIAPPQLHRDHHDQLGNQMLCPDGTVPLLRITLDKLAAFDSLDAFLSGERQARYDASGTLRLFGKIWANAYDTRDNLGGASGINVWSPQVLGTQSSASQQWFTSGTSASPFQSVECGYRAGPPFDAKPRLFVFYTPDGYNTLCYNDYHGNWVYRAGASHVLGAALTASQAGGPTVQYRMGFFLTEGNWWFNVGNDWVGYYPVSVFGNGRLATGAASAGFGGEVHGAGSAFPTMGSGKKPAAGYGQAAYQHDVIISRASGAESAVLVPEPTSANCYGIDVTNNSGTSWGTYLFFGGPGGLNC
ncbi:neprosin family prolyl endopeptidase [Streptomyces virginiae]|uniref:Neprosin family prolyl endopeptidase n=1 Tax=Streptomyces virginiae TaxID=1961 RepID=A0ABZ1TSK1_STRVG|nr:neprosin family prolyl endopeptidase [Streptomyces virginiae]